MTTDPVSPPHAPAGRSATRRAVAWFAVTVAVLVGVAGFVHRSMSALIDQSGWVAHTHEVLATLHQTAAHVRDAEAAQRGFLLSDEPEFLTAYHVALGRVPQDIDRLRTLIADNPDQQPRIDHLEAEVRERLTTATTILAVHQKDGLAAAQEHVRTGRGRKEMDDVMSAVRGIEAEERRLLAARQAATAGAARTTLLVGGLCLAACLGVLALLFGLVWREWGRRRQTEGSLHTANARLEQTLIDRDELAREAAVVSALGDYLHACKTPKEAYAILAQTVPHLLPGVSGSVGITSHSRVLVETVLAWGDGPTPTPTFHPDECWGLRRGRVHRSGGGGCDPGCGHLGPDPAGDLCLPMAVHGGTLGVLTLRTARPAGFTDREKHAARAMAEQVSLALANLRLQEALRDQSIRDPLTGLFNRRYLEESLSREVCRARRHGQAVAVVMADVDHFKRLNDTFGHETGDVVLAEVGKLFARHIRGEDVACRYGGEEFCLILPGANAEAAHARAEEIREAVSRLNVRHGSRPIGPVTLSAGVAVYPDQTEETVVAAADAALYRAKQAGRNRVMTAGEPHPAEPAPCCGAGCP